MELITCYLRLFIFYELSLQMNVLSLATLARTYPLKAIIYTKLKWNCLVKKIPIEGRSHLQLFPYCKINFPTLELIVVCGPDKGSPKSIKPCPLS